MSSKDDDPKKKKLPSAMKGGRKKQGKKALWQPQVKWAEDVYDPPTTAPSHTKKKITINEINNTSNDNNVASVDKKGKGKNKHQQQQQTSESSSDSKSGKKKQQQQQHNKHNKGKRVVSS